MISGTVVGILDISVDSVHHHRMTSECEIKPGVLVAQMMLSNKQWAWRLGVVMQLELWIKEHLKNRGEFDRVDRSDSQKTSKAKDYLYGFLFWGRRHFSSSEDPLFFHHDGDSGHDECLFNQLLEGAYALFIAEFHRLMVMPALDAFPDVSLADVEQFVVGPSRRVVDSCISGLCTDDSDLCEQAHIGLILRYRCVGGFDSNMHGSVRGEWSDLLSGFVECFASPLNHKFEAFHSLFDEDRVFGGRGDFFQFVSQNGGVLPSGDYEVSPPFNAALIDHVAETVKRSFDQPNACLRVVCVVPNWPGAVFLDILASVLQKLGEHGLAIKQHYKYTHTNGRPLQVQTQFFVFCSPGVSVPLKREFFSTCQRLTSGSTRK